MDIKEFYKNKPLLSSLIIFGLIFGLIFYGYATDFQFLKNLIGYNVPPKGTPPASSPTPSVSASPSGTQLPASSVPYLSMPDGFYIDAFATGLSGPRVIAWDPAGRMVVSETTAGRVSILEDGDKNGIAEERSILLGGLNRPHGLAFLEKDGTTYLYVAETDKIIRYSYDPSQGRTIGGGQVLFNLPSGGGHFTRTISFGPDGKLYTSIGSSCNICNESDERRAAIYVSEWDGSGFRQYARGLRNSVFFTFNPVTNEMWATEMGRDNLGDDIPPDEVNIIKDGGNYGWPICYGKNIHDTVFDKNTYVRNPCLEPFETASHIDLQAHSAPLGLAFWNNKLIVAFHGSWNRSVPTGYKVVYFDTDRNGNIISQQKDFVTGFLANGQRYGRPVDVKFGPDGALYVSDDSAGMIYRIQTI